MHERVGSVSKTQMAALRGARNGKAVRDQVNDDAPRSGAGSVADAEHSARQATLPRSQRSFRPRSSQHNRWHRPLVTQVAHSAPLIHSQSRGPQVPLQHSLLFLRLARPGARWPHEPTTRGTLIRAQSILSCRSDTATGRQAYAELLTALRWLVGHGQAGGRGLLDERGGVCGP